MDKLQITITLSPEAAPDLLAYLLLRSCRSRLTRPSRRRKVVHRQWIRWMPSPFTTLAR